MIKDKVSVFILATIFCSLVLCACDSELDKKSLEAYVLEKDNGLYKGQEVPPFIFQVNYRPSSLMALQSIDSLTEKKVSEYETLVKGYDRYMYFNLSMSANGVDLLRAVPKNRYQFSQYVNTLAFGMKGYVFLTTDKSDTLQFVESNFARMYGMSRTTNVLLIFKRDSTKLEAKELNFELKDFGTGAGNLNFRFKLSDINQIPDLKH